MNLFVLHCNVMSSLVESNVCDDVLYLLCYLLSVGIHRIVIINAKLARVYVLNPYIIYI